MQIKLPSFMTKINLWSASASKQNKRAKFLMLIKAVQSFEEERVVVSQGKKFFLLFFCLSIFFYFLSDVFGGPHERRLLNDLMEHYNTLERPVYNESEPLQLLFGLTLQQIIDVVSMEHSILVFPAKIHAYSILI